MRKLLSALSLFALAAATVAMPAKAAPFYQSVPDLFSGSSGASGYCSECGADTQQIGERFTLASDATVNSAQFVVSGAYVWPTPVTVSIYQDGGGLLGSLVFSQTYSTFASDTPVGDGSNVVSISLPGVALAAGTYDIFLTNPTDLSVPWFNSGDPSGIWLLDPSSPPSVGGSYNSLGSDIGIALSGDVIGRPATDTPAPGALALLGFGLAGLARLRRKAKTA